MKICILGAGSLGCAIGGALSAAGSEVWLVNRSRTHVEAMNTAGLRIRGEGGDDRFIKVNAATDAGAIGPVDLVIVLVKSFDTNQAMRAASNLFRPDTAVMSLQNGLGNEDIIAEFVGSERVLAGRTYIGGQLIGPGYIISGTAGKRTIIGELNGAITPRVERIAAEFNRAGLETKVSANIMGTIWDKLLVNAATGPVAAITGLAYGALYKSPLIEAVAIEAVEEAMAVARASGIELSIREPREAWLRAGTGLPDDFKPSMLQSLEKGSVTEIDFINGAIVREGKRCNIPTPVNATLVACIKGIESRLTNDRGRP